MRMKINVIDVQIYTDRRTPALRGLHRNRSRMRKMRRRCGAYAAERAVLPVRFRSGGTASSASTAIASVERHHLLLLAAEAPHRDRALLGLALADHQHHRRLGQRVLAHLVVDLLVAQIDLRRADPPAAGRPAPPRRRHRHPTRWCTPSPAPAPATAAGARRCSRAGCRRSAPWSRRWRGGSSPASSSRRRRRCRRRRSAPAG